MNTKSILKALGLHALAFCTAFLAVQSAFAIDRNLINSALNETLNERADAEKSYESNEAVDRPRMEARRTSRPKSGRIEVVIDGGIGGIAGGGSLKDHSNEEVYREKRVQVKLDKELESVEKDLAVSPELNVKKELAN